MIKIYSFEELHPNCNKQLIEDVLYKAAVILLKRKNPLFKRKMNIGTDDINYIIEHWDD